MGHIFIPSHVNKTCSACRHSVPEEGFFRKGKLSKTCNQCSAKSCSIRKTESFIVYDQVGRRMEALYLGQPFDQEVTGFLAEQQRAEQLRFEQDYFEQQRFELHQFSHKSQQPDPRMTVDYILNDSNHQEYTPLQSNEQHRIQPVYGLQSTQEQTDLQLMCQQNTQVSMFPPNPDPDRLPCYELLDPNFWAHHATNGAEQVYYGYADHGSDDAMIDFDEYPSDYKGCADFSNCSGGHLPELNLIGKTDLKVESPGLTALDADFRPQCSQSFVEYDDIMDLDIPDSELGFDFDFDRHPAATQKITSHTATGQMTTGELQAERTIALPAQPQAPKKSAHKPRPKPISYCLDQTFANFNASEDILRQLASPPHAEDMTGEALAAHLISECGLAVRLSALHGRWTRKKQGSFLREVSVLNRLENKGDIVPWGPLSDWLTLCENETEDIIDYYGYGNNLDFKTKAKVALCRKRMARKIKLSLHKAAVELMLQNTQALLKLFSDDSKLPEDVIKKELDRQLRSLQFAVMQDCLMNGVLRLNVGPHGTYIQG